MRGRKSLLILMGNLAGALAGLVAIFAVGRYMTPATFGMFGFALSVASLGAIVARFGLESAHIKRLADGTDPGACLATYTRLKLFLVAVYVLLLGGAGAVWESVVGFTDTTLAILLVAIGYTALAELRFIPITTFNAHSHTARAQSSLIVDHVVRSPLVVLAALGFGAAAGRWTPGGGVGAWVASKAPALGSTQGGALALAAAYAVAMGVSLIVAVRFLARPDYAMGRFDAPLAKDYVIFALPLTFNLAASQISNQMDKVMLGFFWEADDVGLYFAMQRLVSFVLMVPGAVGTLFYPMIAELAQKREPEGVRVVAHSTQRILSLVMVFLAAILITFPAEGIHIFLSDAYLGGAPVLRLLAIQALLFAFSVVATTILLGYEKPAKVAISGAITMVANVALNLLFVPTSILGVPLLGMGATGAAWATVIAAFLGIAYAAVHAHRCVGGSYQPASFIKHLLAAGAMHASIHFLRPTSILGGMDRWWELLGGGFVGAAVYAGALILMRELGRKDWLLLLDIFHPGKMVRYVRDELRKR